MKGSFQQQCCIVYSERSLILNVHVHTRTRARAPTHIGNGRSASPPPQMFSKPQYMHTHTHTIMTVILHLDGPFLSTAERAAAIVENHPEDNT